jgi:N-methylhydantoinase A
MGKTGVDVGGTFTDIVVFDLDHGFSIAKILSSPSDYSAAIQFGLQQLIREGSLTPSEVTSVVHAFTVATNAVLTGKGARVGLITTAGFRDVLEIGRLRMPKLYDMEWDKPRPLVPRYLRREVMERIDFRGQVVTPLQVATVHQALDALLVEHVDSVAVCLLNSYINPIHEEQIAAILAKKAPHLVLSVSHRILPEIKEYERTSTTVTNAYIKPIVGGYLEKLERRLGELQIRAPLMIMQSSGGTMKVATAREQPIRCIESGPAAGAVGAAAVGKRLGCRHLIAFDMGGTTAKVCLIEDGEPRLASEMEVGGGINVGQRLLKGGGYVVRIPAIDLVEIGAGGGSIAWIDRGRALRVGPQSAGADPGPACYSLGGEDPTVTDANVVLGHLSREYLLGGEMAIDAGLAEKALAGKLGDPLGISLDEAAHGVHIVVNSNMVRAIKAVSSEIGRDPADFTLFAFGGSGPVHAASLAVQARIPRVIVPPAPGVFSALGLLFTVAEQRAVQTFWRNVQHADLEQMNTLLHGLEQDASAVLVGEGFKRDQIEVQHFADLRYAGQSSELSIIVPHLPVTGETLPALVAAFHSEHEQTYGYQSPEEPVQFVNLRVRARASSPRDTATDVHLDAIKTRVVARVSLLRDRRVYFGQDAGWTTVPVIRRSDLRDLWESGPLVVEEYDSTVVVPPGGRARLDEHGNIHVDVTALL